MKDSERFYLKELRNYKRKLFLCPPQKWAKQNQLLFFTINLYFATSNQISTYRELNLPLSSSIYFGFLPLEMQKRLKQTKVCHAFSYFVWKETTHEPLEMAATNSLFSSVYVIGTTCFDECFSFYVITKRHYSSSKFIVTLRLF